MSADLATRVINGEATIAEVDTMSLKLETSVRRRYGVTQQDSEDFASKAILSVFKFSQTRPIDKTSSVLYRSVGRKVIDKFRVDKSNELPLETDIPGPNFDEQSRLKIDVASALVQLPNHYREIILLHYFDQLSLLECGEALGISIGTVKSRLNKALSQLRKIL